MFADTATTTLKGYYLSERAVTVVFAHQISLVTTQTITNINRQLLANPFPGFKAAVPAYTTLTVYFDPQQLIESNLKGWDNLQKVVNYVSGFSESSSDERSTAAIVEIPVCYDAEFGFDLEELSVNNKLSIDEIIQLHSTTTYTVSMIGFTPGFAYLGGLDKRLFAPRKQTPRAAVPAGSVGIAGEQTGVYPLTIPSGWQIIGRTPLTLFNADLAQPVWLKMGDQVQFKPIDRITFNKLADADQN